MTERSKWSINRSAFAGAGAGLVTSIAGCPLDVVKTKLQAQELIHGNIGYKGVWGMSLISLPLVGFFLFSFLFFGRLIVCGATVVHINRTSGLRGFYRGLGPTILGYLPTWAIYFTVYDSVKKYFGEEALGEVRHVVDRALESMHIVSAAYH